MRGHSINKKNVFEKRKINFFSKFFFYRYKHCIVWNWFMVKFILILQKYFFWGYSKWLQIKHCSRLEQRSVIKLLVAEKCKFTEECVMCMEKHVLVKKIFTNRLNIGLARQAWVKKKIHRRETWWLSDQETILDAADIEEGHADCLLGHDMTRHYWFSWERGNSKQWFLFPTPLAKLTFFKMTLIYIYIHTHTHT